MERKSRNREALLNFFVDSVLLDKSGFIVVFLEKKDKSGVVLTKSKFF